MLFRSQVEHPITEAITGIDLVEWQLRIAAGEHLTIRQEDVTWTGSAVECRVYAEDPEMNYMPSPGRIDQLREPSGPGIRLDSGIYAGWTVPMEYDPLLAKLCAWAGTREAAIDRLDRAISEYALTGVKTNLALFREILSDTVFRSGKLSTAYLDEFFQRRAATPLDIDAEATAALVLALTAAERRSSENGSFTSNWAVAGRREMMR